jgi:AcrR family transcriptional regulator
MPRAWSEREKGLVKKSLQQEGKKLFEKYGLQKTTVEEIVRASRISKGAFYLFYPSKEALYFDILETMERELHQKIYGEVPQPGETKRESFRKFLRSVVDVLTTAPLYRQLSSSDYEYLLRKVPEETVNAHVRNDLAETARYFGSWMEKGWMRRVDPQALNGILLSLFYFVMHREDFGGAGFEAARDLWIDMLSTYLIPEEKRGNPVE